MLGEEHMISRFVTKMQTGQSVEQEVKMIKEKYKSSTMLNYYLGYYYEKCDDIPSAVNCFQKCNRLCPSFTHPIFHMANYAKAGLLPWERVEDLLFSVMDKPTLDPTTGATNYQLQDQCTVLGFLMMIESYLPAKRKEKLYDAMKRVLEKGGFTKYQHIEFAKNACSALARRSILFHDVDSGLKYYVKGLKSNVGQGHELTEQQRMMLSTLDRGLYEGFMLTKDFCVGPIEMPIEPNEIFEPMREQWPVANPRSGNRKIRVGYISPDLNKNAVGLFCTALLKHYDPERFDVFCYYNNQDADEFTRVFQTCPVTWTNIAELGDGEVYNMMRNEHQIDILIDLIACGSRNRLRLIARKPAPIIVNYLGYPGRTHLKEYTHRIVDSVTDPVEYDACKTSYAHSETLVRLPKCFICYHMFENIVVPPVKIALKPGSAVTIGMTNRSAKMHPMIIDAWKRIVNRCPGVKLVIKLDADLKRNKLFQDFPQDRIEYIPFMDTLEEYLELHNSIDFFLDTYPYSGTTTTSTALFMGKPVMTVYDPVRNNHVSNVSASLLKSMGVEFADPFIASSVDDYVERVVAISTSREWIEKMRDEDYVMARKDAFLRAMDPVAFMEDYESCLEKLAMG